MAHQDLQETCYNGENDSKYQAEFEQHMIKLGAKPKLIKVLMEHDYDSLDILRQLKTDNDVSEVVNECNLKSAQKFQLKAIIEKIPNLLNTELQLKQQQIKQMRQSLQKLNQCKKKIDNGITNKRVIIEKLFKEIQISIDERKQTLIEQLNKIGKDKNQKLDEEYKLCQMDKEFECESITNYQINIDLDVKNELMECINKLGTISLLSKNKQDEFHYKIFKYENIQKIVNNSDKNGIIYYMGTKYINSNEWINPFKHEKIINIHTTELEKGNILSQFIDRRVIKTFKTKNIKNSFFIIDFNKIKIKPSHYTLRHSSGYGYYLRFWSFEGFNIYNNKWEIVKEHINDRSLSNKNKIACFVVNCNEFYSKFRLIMNKKNSGDHFGLSGGDWTFCVCGFELYGESIFP